MTPDPLNPPQIPGLPPDLQAILNENWPDLVAGIPPGTSKGDDWWDRLWGKIVDGLAHLYIGPIWPIQATPIVADAALRYPDRDFEEPL